MESSTVPSKPEDVEERDHRAAAIVLPEFEERLKDAHARNAHPRAIAAIQDEYNAARYDEVDAEDDADGDDDGDDGLDGLRRDDLDALASEHGVDLTGARNNGERIARLRDAGVRAD